VVARVGDWLPATESFLYNILRDGKRATVEPAFLTNGTGVFGSEKREGERANGRAQLDQRTLAHLGLNTLIENRLRIEKEVILGLGVLQRL
jgi:hypothetical protein